LASGVLLLPVDRCHTVIRIPQYLASYHTTNSNKGIKSLEIIPADKISHLWLSNPC
jgi:hypothetical protein